MNFLDKLLSVIDGKENVHVNPKRRDLIKAAVKNREVLVSKNGALATWTRMESTGRSPKDTLTVKRPELDGGNRLGFGQQPPPGAGDFRHDPGRRPVFARRKRQVCTSATGSLAPTAATPCRCAPSVTAPPPHFLRLQCSGRCPKISAAASIMILLSRLSHCPQTNWTSKNTLAVCANSPTAAPRTWL